MRTISTIAALLAGGLLAAAQPAQSERPNIIVVLADDMGFSEPGCYGSEIKTPTIDRLAAEGVRFSRFYVANCCGPSRASLNTGCYSWQVGQAPGANIFGNPATPELYHIRLDRSEQKNLATQYPERLREMKKIHAKFYQDPKGPKT